MLVCVDPNQSFLLFGPQQNGSFQRNSLKRKKKAPSHLTNISRLASLIPNAVLGGEFAVSREYDEHTGQGSLPGKRTIRAKDFVAAFREKPDDFHLMLKFSITVRQLETIYSALLGKGLLSESEYNCRERKLAQVGGEERTSPAASTLANLIENPSEVLAELMYSGDQRDSVVTKALEELRLRKEFEKRRSRAEAPTAELCPKCHKAKDSSSPDTCLYCGIVFAKIQPGKHYGEVVVRRAG